MNRCLKPTPSEAWDAGLNVKTAMRASPKVTFAALFFVVKDCIEYMECNKTLRTDNDIIHAVEALIEEFPVMKVEEWVVVCDSIKRGDRGNLYERLKLPELREAFMEHEGRRAERMEQRHTEAMNERKAEPPTQEAMNVMRRLIADLDLPEPTTDGKGRWKFIPWPNDGKEGEQQVQNGQED